MKKFLAILISVMLVLSLSVFAFAEGGDTPGEGGGEGGQTPATPTYTINIDNALSGETYTAYKIFDVAYTNPNADYTAPAAATDIPGTADGTHQNTAYSYTILDTSPWWSVITAESGTSLVPNDTSFGATFDANGLTFTKTANANEWIVEEGTGFDAAEFAQLLNANKTGKTQAASVTANADADAGTVNMTNTTTHSTTGEDYTTGLISLDVTSAGPGYYFVDTSAGSLCSLDTTEPTATIREKNDLPTQDKSVCKVVDGTYGDSVSANIGDTVYFKIEVTDGLGTDAAITVHDTMSAGLTLGATSAFVVKAPTGENGAEVTLTQDEDYTVTAPGSDGHSFDLVINAAIVSQLDAADVITITYPATLNANAVIASEGNENTSYITYMAQATPEDEAKVYTYAGAIYKVDGTASSGAAPELAGATFSVTDASGNAVGLTQISAGDASTPAVYKYDTSSSNSSIVTPASGAVVLIGFEENTVLTLTETAAPTGFNLLSSPVTLTINQTAANTADKSATVSGGATATFVASTYTGDPLTLTATGDDAAYQIHANSIEIIENNTGSELPSTGGIGTTIFYIVGAILVLGAAIILIAKRRSAAAEA